jgi:hypothetical protein
LYLSFYFYFILVSAWKTCSLFYLPTISHFWFPPRSWLSSLYLLVSWCINWFTDMFGLMLMSIFVSRTCDRVAVVVTRLCAGWSLFQFLMGQEIFIFSKMSRLPVGSTEPPVQCVAAFLSWGDKASGVWSKPLTLIWCQG